MKLRGHKIEEISPNRWRYSDTKESTVESWKKRPCGYCGLVFTKEGHDGCLGVLPGVMNACCGHGSSNSTYVQFLGGLILRGEEANKKIEELKNK